MQSESANLAQLLHCMTASSIVWQVLHTSSQYCIANGDIPDKIARPTKREKAPNNTSAGSRASRTLLMALADAACDSFRVVTKFPGVGDC